MSQFLTVIKFIVTILPFLKDTIGQLQQLFPEPGRGADKMAMLNTMLEQAVSVEAELQSGYQVAKPVLQPVLNALVALVKGKPVVTVPPAA